MCACVRALKYAAVLRKCSKLIELMGIDEALRYLVADSYRGRNAEKKPTPYDQ